MIKQLGTSEKNPEGSSPLKTGGNAFIILSGIDIRWVFSGVGQNFGIVLRESSTN